MKNLILYLSFVLFIKTATFSQSIPWELLPNFDNDYCTLESTNLIQNILTTNNCYIFDNSIDFCRKFIPTLNQQIISIRLNLVFIQKSDGTGNFREDNQEEQSIINDMINELNRIYANWVNPNDPLCYVGTDFVSDSRIQFIANKIFIRDNFGWNNKNDLQTIKCPGISNWYLNS